MWGEVESLETRKKGYSQLKSREMLQVAIIPKELECSILAEHSQVGCFSQTLPLGCWGVLGKFLGFRRFLGPGDPIRGSVQVQRFGQAPAFERAEGLPGPHWGPKPQELFCGTAEPGF